MVGNMLDREYIQQIFIRIAKDSKFKMDAIEVAKMTASLAKVHPLEVMGSFSFDNMIAVANGTHPVVKGKIK